jgi:creatinine amidohydrolase
MLHGYIPPKRFLPYLTWKEIADMPDKASVVIVLPVGSIEQHGPHLSCAVDTQIAAGVIGHALARLPDSVPAYAMAPITYGGPTMLAMMNEIGESVYRSGFRKLLLVNGHGGQPQIMEMSARELRIRHGDFIVVPHFTWRVPHVAGTFLSEKEKRLAMHAGHAETALVMALAPDTVHLERAVASYPPEFPSKTLSADGRPAAAWTARDFGPSGVIGDPLPSKLEEGQAILDSLAESWARAITELHQMRWADRPEESWGASAYAGHVTQTL